MQHRRQAIGIVVVGIFVILLGIGLMMTTRALRRDLRADPAATITAQHATITYFERALATAEVR